MTILNELDSTCGLSDEELTVRFRESIRIDNEVRRIKGLQWKWQINNHPNGKDWG